MMYYDYDICEFCGEEFGFDRKMDSIYEVYERTHSYEEYIIDWSKLYYSWEGPFCDDCTIKY